MSAFHVEQQLPIQWQRVTAATNSHTTNSLIYSILENHDASVPHHGETEENASPPRLEAKLNLLLVLVSQLLQSHRPTPAETLMRMGPEQLAWQESSSSLQVGEKVCVQVYPDSVIPQPLYLYGTVVSGENNWTTIQLAHPNEVEASAWQRWVFRQHRRQVARQRHPDN